MVQVFSEFLTNRRVVMYCDNQAVVSVVNTGRARDKLLQRCLRWLCHVLAEIDCLIKLKYIDTKENRMADSLSRSHQGEKERLRCDALIAQYELQEVAVNDEMMILQEPW